MIIKTHRVWVEQRLAGNPVIRHQRFLLSVAVLLIIKILIKRILLVVTCSYGPCVHSEILRIPLEEAEVEALVASSSTGLRNSGSSRATAWIGMMTLQ